MHTMIALFYTSAASIYVPLLLLWTGNTWGDWWIFFPLSCELSHDWIDISSENFPSPWERKEKEETVIMSERMCLEVKSWSNEQWSVLHNRSKWNMTGHLSSHSWHELVFLWNLEQKSEVMSHISTLWEEDTVLNEERKMAEMISAEASTIGISKKIVQFWKIHHLCTLYPPRNKLKAF